MVIAPPKRAGDRNGVQVMVWGVRETTLRLVAGTCSQTQNTIVKGTAKGESQLRFILPWPQACYSWGRWCQRRLLGCQS